MKLLIAVVLAAIVAAAHSVGLTEEETAEAKQHFVQCMEQERITVQQIAKLRAGDFEDIGQDVKCFGNCFLEKAGVLKNGVLQESVIMGRFAQSKGEGKAKQILAACRGEKGPNNCETAYLLLACLKEQNAIIL